MQLLYTPCSHFSRKVRIIAAGIGVDIQLLDVGNVANLSGNQLELNPLMKVPTLIHNELVLFDSDAICAYLVRHHDPADRFGVLSSDLDLLNARTVMNGVMSAEVELILAARTGLDIISAVRFDKFRQAIVSGLWWLEARYEKSFQSLWNQCHLVCLWDHLEFVSQLLPAQAFPQLRECVARSRLTAFVADSSFPRAVPEQVYS